MSAERLEDWPPQELCALVLDAAASLEDFAAFLERRQCFRNAPEDGALIVEAQVSAALEVEFVDWKDIDGYIRRLDALRLDLRAFSQTAPKNAASAALAFFDRLPAVFDRVNCAEEMAGFCDRLAADLLRLAGPRAIAPILTAFTRDEHGHFHGLLDVLMKEAEPVALKTAIAGRLEALEGREAAYEVGALRRALGRLG